MASSKLQALFQSIGGEPTLKIILRDFYSRMASDILIGYFFQGKDLLAISDRQTQFLLYGSGLIKNYSGKSPTTAHRSLPPISQGHFDRRLILLRETLQEHGLSESNIQIWIDFENAFRDVITF